MKYRPKTKRFKFYQDDMKLGNVQEEWLIKALEYKGKRLKYTLGINNSLSFMGVGLSILKGDQADWKIPEFTTNSLLYDGPSFMFVSKSYKELGLRDAVGSFYKVDNRYYDTLNFLKGTISWEEIIELIRSKPSKFFDNSV